jgi:hypothetical protein
MTSSPTFVAVFSDRERSTTRMTVWHSPGRQSLDLGRGVRLAQAAYQSRTNKAPPAIASAHYERDGEVIQKYSAEEIEETKS